MTAPAPSMLVTARALPEHWTFFAHMLVSREPLGPVHPFGFGYTRRLSGFGNASISMPADSSALPAQLARELWAWRLTAFYDGSPVFVAVPSGLADEARTAVELTMTEITGYLGVRAWDVHPSRRYTQTEQIQIAADIAAPVADVGVRLVTDPGPGFPRDRLYEYLEGPMRSNLLANLCEVIGGPEFRTEYGMTVGGAAVDVVLRIAAPRVGGEAGLGVSVPGSAVSYRAGWDSDKLRTRTFAVGDLPEDAPEGTPRPVAVVDRPQPERPRIDAVDEWPGTILTSTLTERAGTAAGQYAAPALSLTVATLVSTPPLGSYGPGDDVAVRLLTPALPGGYEVTGRLTDVSVSAADGTATWTIAVEVPPPQPRATLSQRLGRLDLTIGRVFRRGAAPV
jgi:hypothetical protein